MNCYWSENIFSSRYKFPIFLLDLSHFYQSLPKDWCLCIDWDRLMPKTKYIMMSYIMHLNLKNETQTCIGFVYAYKYLASL